jgi:hypothetical protein
MSKATSRPASVRGALTAPSQGAMFVYCNPCQGIPPIVIESPLRYFGVQMLAGLACLLGLLLFGERP